MFSEREHEELTQLVREYTAIRAGASAPIAGRFAIAAGPISKRAKEVRAPVPFGEFDATLAAVMRSAADALASNEGHVYVRAWETGESNFARQVKLEGYLERDPDSDPIELEGNPVQVLTAALVRSNDRLHAMVQERDAKIERYHVGHVQAAQINTQLALRSGAADLAVRQAAAQAGVTQVVDAIKPVLPTLAAAALAWVQQQGGGAAPSVEIGPDADAPPAERIRLHVTHIERAAAGLRDTLAAAGEIPPGAEAELVRLRALVAGIAPMLGLQVS